MWIASGFGAPRKFLIDNGGQFANNLYKEMAAHFNVEVCNTGAESPWQNGILYVRGTMQLLTCMYV